MGEGIGLLIKEIRELKQQQQRQSKPKPTRNNVANNKPETIIMAAAIQKAMRSIQEAQSAVGIANTPVYAQIPHQPAVPLGVLSPGSPGSVELNNALLQPNRFIGVTPNSNTLDNVGYLQSNEFTRPNLVRNAALMDAEKAFEARINQENSQVAPIPSAQAVNLDERLHNVATALSLGPKASSKFYNGISTGINQVTKQYLDRLNFEKALRFLNSGGGRLKDNSDKLLNEKEASAMARFTVPRSVPESKRAEVADYIDENDLLDALTPSDFLIGSDDRVMNGERRSPDRLLAAQLPSFPDTESESALKMTSEPNKNNEDPMKMVHHLI